MATFIPGTNRFAGLEAFGKGLIQGNDKRFRRKQLLSGLSPEQQESGQGLPLTQLTQLVTGLAQNKFLSPLQKSQMTLQGLKTNRNLATARELDGINSSAFTPAQATDAANAGIIRPQARPRELTEFEKIRARLTDDDKVKADRIRARLDPGATREGKPGTKRISFDREFGLDDKGNLEVGSVTEFVPEQFQAIAQDIGNKRGAVNPKDQFKTHLDRIENTEGFDESTQVDQGDVLEVVPDMVQGAIIKGLNPVTALQDMFKTWDTVTLRDKGPDVFSIAEDVKMSTVSPLPTDVEQNVFILQSVEHLLDEGSQDDMNDAIASGDADRIKKEVAKVKKLFRGRR